MPSSSSSSASAFPIVLLSALAMSVGWGFRGDYGHEAGAMVPGALVALAVALASGRTDWQGRAALAGFCGAVGWAFGGQMSYGLIVGYTAHSELTDVAYGFACLFLIGALWGGAGSAILGLGLTRPRSELNRFAGPLLGWYLTWTALKWSGALRPLWDSWHGFGTDWIAATFALLYALVHGALVPSARPACRLIGGLAMGWWAGFAILVCLLGLRMTPPRGDNWAGCVGVVGALIIHLVRTRNRAALVLTLYGLMAGGVGFAFGDFLNMLGRAQWGPIGSVETLRGLDYWKWMEQSFGLIMGAGIGLGAARLARGGLRPVVEDEPSGLMGHVAPLFLLVAMLWENLFKNVRNWLKDGHLHDGLFGLGPAWWFAIVGLALTSVFIVAIVQDRRGALALAPPTPTGRTQLLFLLILWIAVISAFAQAFPGMKHRGALLVHVSFWLTAIACSLIALTRPIPARDSTAIAEEGAGPDSLVWAPGWRHWTLWALMPVLIFAFAQATVRSHGGPLYGAHSRFGAEPNPPATRPR